MIRLDGLKVDRVTIKLTGKYDLSKLDKLRYQCHGKERYFDGKMHRYFITPKDETHLEINVFQRPDSDKQLIPSITFKQIQDWVGESVRVIEVERP